MDNQIPNTSGNSPDNQTPDTDIFQAKLQDETADIFQEQMPTESSNTGNITEKEGFGEEKTSCGDEKVYTDPNHGYGENANAFQSMGGYESNGQNLYGSSAPKQNENPYQGTYQNCNQNGPAYQQPNYGGNANGSYQQGYNGNPNGGCQQGYNGNPNGGCQQGYNGNPNGGYQQGYNGNQSGGHQSNYIGVPYTGYQQNNSNSFYDGMDTSPMTMGDWLLTLLACMIPCAGTILSLVWAFGKHGNVNRRNFCRAQLIITAVVLVLYFIVVLIWGVSLAGALSTY